MSKKPTPADASEIRTLEQKPDSAPAAEAVAEQSGPLQDVTEMRDTPEARQAAANLSKAVEDLKQDATPAEQATLEDLALRQANHVESKEAKSDLPEGSDWKLHDQLFQDACIISNYTGPKVRVVVREQGNDRHVEIYLVPLGDQLVFEADGKITELGNSHKDSSFEVGMVSTCHPGAWLKYLENTVLPEALGKIDQYDASRFEPVDDSSVFA